MRKTLALFAVVLTLGLAAGFDAEAKRLGGGRSSGMQRNAVTAPTASPNTATGVQAQTAPVAGSATAAAAGAATATAKRSWMGPLAGIAAGLGIAALASHFGLGGALANMLTMALLAMAAFALIGFVMRKRAGAQSGALAGTGAGANGLAGGSLDMQQIAQRSLPAGHGGSLIGSGIGGGAAVAAVGGRVGTIPTGFDTAAFERAARDQFMALQVANDARDLDRLRDYLTPDMFDVVRGEVAERGDAAQKTEVFGLQSQVLDVAEQDGQYIVSVHFSGSVRTEAGATPEDLDEVWHLTKPLAGVGGWIIAGIQQRE
jgi:predicted lipid-binding transport protein (Tim44 family)